MAVSRNKLTGLNSPSQRFPRSTNAIHFAFLLLLLAG